MKKIIITSIILTLILIFSYGVRKVYAATLVQYLFADGVPSTVATGLTASTIVNNTMGTWELPSNQGYSTDPELRVGPKTSAISQATAVTNNSYFVITITPDSGKKFTLTSMTFKIARGGAATPRGWGLRSSLDTYAANIDTADAATQRTTWADITVDLTGGTYDNLTSAITFRFYIYAPATGNTLEVDNITFNGTVEDITTSLNNPSVAITGFLKL